ncbi:hypothetical protein AURDEDRAFT_164957 [Auricularia subglabra TFB-10046 SS5]|nr:hypothetical protein AURDEDRAFT_164957 [Auricularia subglabra TFB-10046 SS5]
MDALTLASTVSNGVRGTLTLCKHYAVLRRISHALLKCIESADAQIQECEEDEAEITKAVLEPLIDRARDVLLRLRSRRFRSLISQVISSGWDDDVSYVQELIRDFRAAPAEIRSRFTAKQVQSIARDLRMVMEAHSDSRPLVEVTATFTFITVQTN